MVIQKDNSVGFKNYPNDTKLKKPKIPSKKRYQYRVFNIQAQLEQGLVGKVPKIGESTILNMDALNFLGEDGWHAICKVADDYLLLEKEK